MNPVSIDSSEIVYRINQIKSVEEQIKYWIECFLFGEQKYPTIEEINEKRNFFSQHDDLEDAPNWVDRQTKERAKKMRQIALQELNRHTELGFNPYQE